MKITHSKMPYFNLLKSMWHYGASWRFHIVGYYILYVIAQMISSLSPFALGKAIDILQVFSAERFKELIFWLSAGLIALLAFWIFHGPARIIERRVALKLKQNFKLSMYDKLTFLELKWHQHHHSGNIIARIQRSANALYHFAENQYVYVETLVRFIISIIFLLWISIPIGITCLLTSFIVMYAIIAFDQKLVTLYDYENEIENETGGMLVDYINNMTTVLTLRLGKLTKNELSKKMYNVWKFFNKEIILNESKWFTLMIMLSLLQTLILIIYIFNSLLATNSIKIGTVIMIFNYQSQVNAVFHDVSTHISQIIRMNTDINSIEPILNEIKDNIHLQNGINAINEWKFIEINNLVFHPSIDQDNGVNLEANNFKLERKQRIALIGKSGSGKSTLLNVLSGLYKPSKIELNVDNNHYDSLEPLRTITTLIPQDAEIFNNTITYNITMGIPAKSSEIYHSAQLAGFSGVIDMLPKGLESEISEKGLNLSGSQKQRLALARGLFAARNSSLILIDETTSSLDLQSEQQIILKLLECYPESTLIISLHRLHLLPYFDSVIMLNEGRTLANGPIKKLLYEDSPVQSLWRSYQKLYTART